jgi:hypothetical protein
VYKRESPAFRPGAAAISLIDDLTDKASKDCPVGAADRRRPGEAAANQTGDREEGGKVLSAVIASVSEAIQTSRAVLSPDCFSLRSSQ